MIKLRECSRLICHVHWKFIEEKTIPSFSLEINFRFFFAIDLWVRGSISFYCFSMLTIFTLSVRDKKGVHDTSIKLGNKNSF